MSYKRVGLGALSYNGQGTVTETPPIISQTPPKTIPTDVPSSSPYVPPPGVTAGVSTKTIVIGAGVAIGAYLLFFRK